MAESAGKDESSIKPVSSLRSRFENLQRDNNETPPASPIGGRPAFLTAGSSVQGSRPVTPVSPAMMPNASGPATRPVLPLPTPRRLGPGVSPSRPQSMVNVTSTQDSPPLLTVESPHSGRKNTSVDLRNATGNTPSLTPARTGAESPTRSHARTLSRATTPALEARMSALLQPSDTGLGSQTISSMNGSSLTASTQEKIGNSTGPPPINRAGKPKVPTKPATLAQNPEALAAPKDTAGVGEKGVSPFSTPPGSTHNSPRLPADWSRPRNESNASSIHRVRADSDTSFVERVRTNSGASNHRASFMERARAGSNASFVEPSTLPESWHLSHSPPMHHQTAVRRDPPTNGMARPARYRPISTSEITAAGDLPDDRPRLPSRPELLTRSGRNSPPKARSGRTSPVKEMFQRHHTFAFDSPKRANHLDGAQTPPRIPAVKATPKSALTQGFDRIVPAQHAASSHAPPPVPAPRRSMDSRRETQIPAVIPAVQPVSVPPPSHVNGHSYDDEEDAPAEQSGYHPTAASDYPDSSQASRRPPRYKQRPWQIPTEYDTRTFAVCGEYVCTTGHRTKVWNLRTGEKLVDLDHPDVRVTSLVFKPSASVEDEGKRIWLGTSIGDIHELDVPAQSFVRTRSNVHTRKEIVRMFRYASELWTLDDNGDLNVWKSDQSGALSLDAQFKSFRTLKGHTYSIALGKHLWFAKGKEVYIFAPSAKSEADFQVRWNPLSQPNTGDIHSGATLSSKADLVYFGHQDGKVSIYNRNDYSCAAVVNVSMYKLSSMAGVGDYIWAGFNTGMAYVYDTSTNPWTVVKDWTAHEKAQLTGIIAERSAMWKLARLQVVTLGTDNMLRIWDGLLEEDWLDSRMQEHDSEYCSFSDLSAAVLTWNAGAAKPHYLQRSIEDSNFFPEYFSSRGEPDIFVFGFQELVDLEDKKVTAKSFFKGKKKDASEQEHIGHQYRAWRDHLTKCLDELMPTSKTYTLLHTASMVGLFTCIFVKSSLRSRIQHVHASEVKRGMAGYHGNKGALILRMVLDDSSLCFINCHLAAGQTQTIHRNNDIAAILESETLPSYPLSHDSIAQHSDVFASGGDGSMILDHEICILNGDLNYRIDTMGRDTVIKHIAQNNLSRLLERDQLLLTKKRNPGFRLRAFQESEIRFAPTYKYDLGKDEYDTSEKRRAPAWCDRILYRGKGKVKMGEYRRWNLRVSDHRPVSGLLKVRVKAVDRARREKVWEICRREFEEVRARVARDVQLEYLSNVLGLSMKEATAALR